MWAGVKSRSISEGNEKNFLYGENIRKCNIIIKSREPAFNEKRHDMTNEIFELFCSFT